MYSAHTKSFGSGGDGGLYDDVIFIHIMWTGSMSNIFLSGQEVAAFLETQLPYSYVHTKHTVCLHTDTLSLTHSGSFMSHIIHSHPLPRSHRYLHLLTLITKFHLVFIVFYGSGIISEGISSTCVHVCVF